MSPKNETADQRYRAAYERLKSGKPEILPRGAPVSQNNVAKEAGVDPSALKKSRHLALIREIQAYVEIHDAARPLQVARRRQRRAKEDLRTQVKRLESERDQAQSQLLSANHIVLELIQENKQLQARIESLLPPPTPLRR